MAIYYGGKAISLSGTNQINTDRLIPYKLNRINKISKEDLSGIEEIEPYMFYGDLNLTQIDLPSSIKSIGANAFYNTNIKNLVIPQDCDIKYESLIGMPALEYLDLSKTKLNSNISLQYNTSLKSLHIPVSMNSRLYDAGRYLISLDEILVSDSSPAYSVEDGCLLFKYTYNNEDVYDVIVSSHNSTIPVHMNLREIEPYAFYCKHINSTSVKLPDSINVVDSEAFAFSSGIEELDINTAYLGSFSIACIDSLKTLTVGPCTNVGYGFNWAISGLYNLTQLNIDRNFGTSNASYNNLGIGSNTVDGVEINFGMNTTKTPSYFMCNSVGYVMTSRNSVSKYKSTLKSSIQYDYTLLHSTTPSKIKSINNWGNVNTIETYAFEGCDYKNIVIPDNITAIKTGAYKNIINTETVYFDSNASVYSDIFLSSKMNPNAEITIGPNVSEIPVHLLGASSSSYKKPFKSIKFTKDCKINKIPETFSKYNDNLNFCIIPKSITEIDSTAFDVCSNLSKVYYEGTEAEYNALANSNTLNYYITNAEKIYYNDHIHSGYVVNADGSTSSTRGWTWDLDGRFTLDGKAQNFTEIKPAYTCNHGEVKGKCTICGSDIIKQTDKLKGYTIRFDNENTSTNYGWYALPDSSDDDYEYRPYAYNGYTDNLIFDIINDCHLKLNLNYYQETNGSSMIHRVAVIVYVNDQAFCSFAPNASFDDYTKLSLDLNAGDTLTFSCTYVKPDASSISASVRIKDIVVDHKYAEDTIITECSCNTDGVKKYICQLCGDVHTDSYRDSHDIDLETGKCTICGETIFENQPLTPISTVNDISKNACMYINSAKTGYNIALNKIAASNYSREPYTIWFTKFKTSGTLSFDVKINGDIDLKDRLNYASFHVNDNSNVNKYIFKCYYGGPAHADIQVNADDVYAFVFATPLKDYCVIDDNVCTISNIKFISNT